MPETGDTRAEPSGERPGLLMVWFKNDDAFYSHPKVVSIPRTIRAEALGTWTLCGTWASHHLTDGAIPRHMVDELGGSQVGAAALVKAGLWSRTRTGYLFGSWGEYQPTRAEVEAHRDAERRRKAAYRAKVKGHPTDPETSPAGVPAGHPPESEKRPNTPTRPDPTRTRPEPTTEETLLTEPSSVERPTSTDLVILEPTRNDQPARQRSPYPDAFETFWQVFPRHEGKRKALTAWQAACRRASPEQILDGATRYRDDPNRDDAYTAHPTTWLNRDGWDDAPLPRRRPESQQDRLAASAARMFRDLNAQTRGA